VSNDQQQHSKVFLERYTPLRGKDQMVSAAEWELVRPVVLQAVEPLAHLSKYTLRPFLGALIRLASFAHRYGYEMDVKVLLDPVLVQSFISSVASEAKSPAPYLWRLSRTWGLVDELHPGVPRPDYRAPYSDDEMAALLLAAHNQSSTHRTTTLLAIIFLGAGCGVTREAARDVTATDVHRHGEAWFVRTPRYCARVRDGFLPFFYEVVEYRPSGRLRGGAEYRNVTVKATKWLADRRGVPALSVDRLRATYVCSMLRDGVTVTDVVAWTGLKNTEGLNRYLAYVPASPSICEYPSKGAK
jgi:hypothetical protein